MLLNASNRHKCYNMLHENMSAQKQLDQTMGKVKESMENT